MQSEDIDYAILWETWLDKVPTLIDSNYDLYQTTLSKYQGVCIITRKDWVQKCYINKEPYLIAIQTRNNNRSHFVIGAYFKEQMKLKILESLWTLLKRIRIKHLNPVITVFGDLNTDKNFTIDLIENKTKLKANNTNKTSITRTQARRDKLSTSTLDYFLSNEKIELFRVIGKAGSDHMPITMKIRLNGIMTKRQKCIRIARKRIPKTEEIKEILKNKEWPSKIDLNVTKKLCQFKLNIRPTIKIQEWANKILKLKSWEDARIDIKADLSKSFQEYVKDLDLWWIKDSAKFYKIINSLLKYKVRGKIVKGIWDGDEILFGKQKREKVKLYLEELLDQIQ